MRMRRSQSRNRSSRRCLQIEALEARRLLAVSFEFNYLGSGAIGFRDPVEGAARREAMERAGTELGALFDHTATIEVDVTSSSSGGLASASARFASNPPLGGGYYGGIPYQKILSGADGNGPAADASVTVFFGNATWYAGTGVTPNNAYDLTAIMKHELLHTIGLSSGISRTGSDRWGTPPGAVGGIWHPFDRFVSDREGDSLIDRTNFQLDLAAWQAHSTGGTSPAAGLFFNGPNAVAANGGELLGLYSPGSWLEGSSVSHLDTDNVNYSDRTHLMVHAFGQGTVTRDLHPIEVAMLEDLGYDMTIETDPGNPGYSVVAGGSTVNESGTQVSFSVQLDEQPSSNVQIVVNSSDTTELIVSPVAITFTPSNWNTPQTVTATGVEDGLADGDQVSSVIFAINDAVSDDAFASLPNQSFTVTTVDENVPGLQLTVDGGTTVSEFGTSTAIDVQLTSPPDQDVVIEVTNPAPDEVSLERSRLTFTAANWNVPQTVTVTGVNDGIVDGDQTTLLSFAVLPSVSDPLYVGVDAETVSIVTTDAVANGDQGFVVTNNGSGTVSEDGTGYEFFVELDSAPASPVVITVTPSDPTEVALSRFSLIFTAANWNVPQGVTVRGVDDALFDGDQLSEITLAVDADNSDPAFWSSRTQTFSVVTEDNENAAVVVTAPPTAQITEQTSTNFQVQLGGSPEAPVVIRLTANDGGQSISLSQNQLVFTSDNWNVPRVVTLAGVEDGVVDGDQQVMITVAVDADLSDPGFAEVPDQQFSIEVLDVDELTPPELDFGDAGGTFPTRLEDDGARHVAEGPTLGSSRDTEANSDGAAGLGDDLSQLDDEDGVIAPTVYLGRTSFDLSILAGNVGSSAFLDAWIDFDGDGTWQASEQIMASVLLQEGENVFSIVVPEGLSPVPAGLWPGSRMARFRISSTGGLTTTGWAANGEVEDHAIVFANSDWHNVDRPLDVNGNDGAIPTPLDALAIVNELTNHVYSDPITFELPPEAAPPLFLDVDNNGLVNPLDALLVISGLPSLRGSLAVALPGVSHLPLEARAVVEHASLELPVPGGLESPPLSLPRPLDPVSPPSRVPSIAEAHKKTAASIDRCFADVDWHESLGG